MLKNASVRAFFHAANFKLQWAFGQDENPSRPRKSLPPHEQSCGALCRAARCRQWNSPPPPEGGLGSQEGIGALQVEFSAATCEGIFSDGRRLRFQVAC